jgi:transglutaminase-like putative cysteine protease
MADRLRPTEGWLSLLLVFFLLFVVTLSLSAADWAPGLEILFGTFIAAFVVGLFLAKNAVRGFVAHPFAWMAGLFWVFYAGMGLVDHPTWQESAAWVVIRWLRWLQAVMAQDVATDTLPFVLIMAVLVWLITYNAVWSFFRKQDLWGTLLPAATAILINTYYAPDEITLLLVVFLVLTFLLIVRMNLMEQEVRWQRSAIAYSKEIHYDFFRDGAIFAVAAVAFAWMLPGTLSNSEVNTFLTKLGTPWGQAQQEWSRIFSTLNYQPRSTSGTWFGERMNFRGPINRSDRLVMTVRAPQGRYWRAVVLDSYNSAGWSVSSRNVSDQFDANTEYPREDNTFVGRERVGQQFTIYSPAGTLMFAAGQPLEVSIPSQVLYIGPTSTDAEPTSNAVSQLYGQQTLFQGQTYSAVSAIPVIDVQSLREAGTEYPSWLLDHYTQLPATVTAETTALAQRITQTATNPYDAASMLETYLRTFPYNEGISGPNPGEDGVHYFLFREQQGYCDYYASAMAVMLRSLGVPARIAQGYNQGTLLNTGEYEVRQTNAHTWVEVYFPNYGWIEFEPTASEPGISRPATPFDDTVAGSEVPEGDADSNEDDVLAELRDARENRDEEDATQMTDSGIAAGATPIDLRVLMIPLGVVAAVGAVGMTGRLLVKRRWRGLGLIERLYDQVVLVGRAIGQRLDPSLTPREYAEKVAQQVPPARSPLTRIADLFSKQRYSPQRELDPAEEQEAAAMWKESRQSLFKAMLNRFKPKPREPKVRTRR